MQIENNTVMDTGAAVFVIEGTLAVNESAITANSAVNGAPVFAALSDVMLTGTIVDRNTGVGNALQVNSANVDAADSGERGAHVSCVDGCWGGGGGLMLCLAG